MTNFKKSVLRFLGLTSLIIFSLQANANSSGGSSEPARAVPAEIASMVEQENYPDAIVALNEFIEDESKNADAWNYLGYSQRKVGMLDESLKSYKKALKLDKKHLGAHEYIGELYLTLDELKKAKYHLKKLSKYCDNCEEYKDLEEAIAAFEQDA